MVASRDAARCACRSAARAVIADPLEAIRRPEVDLVVIAAPNDTHARLAALEAASTWWWISRLRWICAGAQR